MRPPQAYRIEGQPMLNQSELYFLFSYIQGLFGVGQSTAKFFNKETGIKTKFK